MVVCNLEPSAFVHVKCERLSAVCRNFLCKMNGKIVLLDSVEDGDLLSSFRKDITGISDFTAHFRIERSAVEYQLVHNLVLGFDSTLFQKIHAFQFGVVVSEELLLFSLSVYRPVSE